MVVARQFLCRDLTSFFTVGFSLEIDWRPRSWGVASLRNRRGSGRG